MATHSSTLAWKIPWTEELGRIQSLGSRRVGHDWATSLSLFTFTHWRRKWQPTPVFLPGESLAEEHGGLPSMGSHRAGHDWSDLAAAAAADYYSLPVPKKYTTYFSSGFFPGTRSFRHIDWCVIIHTETRARTHTHTHTHTQSAVLPGGIQTQSELVETSGSSSTACGLRGCGAATSNQKPEWKATGPQKLSLMAPSFPLWKDSSTFWERWPQSKG